jgi:hypothetical protein
MNAQYYLQLIEADKVYREWLETTPSGSCSMIHELINQAQDLNILYSAKSPSIDDDSVILLHIWQKVRMVNSYITHLSWAVFSERTVIYQEVPELNAINLKPFIEFLYQHVLPLQDLGAFEIVFIELSHKFLHESITPANYEEYFDRLNAISDAESISDIQSLHPIVTTLLDYGRNFKHLLSDHQNALTQKYSPDHIVNIDSDSIPAIYSYIGEMACLEMITDLLNFRDWIESFKYLDDDEFERINSSPDKLRYLEYVRSNLRLIVAEIIHINRDDLAQLGIEYNWVGLEEEIALDDPRIDQLLERLIFYFNLKLASTDNLLMTAYKGWVQKGVKNLKVLDSPSLEQNYNFIASHYRQLFDYEDQDNFDHEIMFLGDYLFTDPVDMCVGILPLAVYFEDWDLYYKILNHIDVNPDNLDESDYELGGDDEELGIILVKLKEVNNSDITIGYLGVALKEFKYGDRIKTAFVLKSILAQIDSSYNQPKSDQDSYLNLSVIGRGNELTLLNHFHTLLDLVDRVCNDSKLEFKEFFELVFPICFQVS